MEQTVIPLIIQVMFAAVASAAFIFLGWLLSPKRPSPVKMSAYECGVRMFHDARVPVKITFYVIAVLFILFEVEILFFFPFACALKDFVRRGISAAVLIEIILFVGVLFIGYLYALAKGAFSWKE
ncbi:MAG: NADH-quinone oxidoreductase subunit A [Spirochaetes bacterium]|nr:NADH-quinone oxidoreductase subunit A [Spirochaetota bacterium]